MTAATVCSAAHLRTSVSQQSRADLTANVARYRHLFGARRRLELEREVVIREGVEQIVALALHRLRRLPVEADQHPRLASSAGTQRRPRSAEFFGQWPRLRSFSIAPVKNIRNCCIEFSSPHGEFLIRLLSVLPAALRHSPIQRLTMPASKSNKSRHLPTV